MKSDTKDFIKAFEKYYKIHKKTFLVFKIVGDKEWIWNNDNSKKNEKKLSDFSLPDCDKINFRAVN